MRTARFSVGDEVVRTLGEYAWEGIYLGKKYIIVEIEKDGQMRVEGLHRWYHDSHFERVY